MVKVTKRERGESSGEAVVFARGPRSGRRDRFDGSEDASAPRVIGEECQAEQYGAERDHDVFGVRDGGDGNAEHFGKGHAREAGGEEESYDFKGGFHVFDEVALSFASAVPSENVNVKRLIYNE
jgi:hypothetical protein